MRCAARSTRRSDPRRSLSLLRAFAGASWTVLVATTSPAATLYVDPLIGTPTCATYDPTSRVCGAGSDSAFSSFASLAGALTTAPGDVIAIREGIYTEALVPGASGAPGAPITYRAYPGETATITGALDPAIFLDGRDHLVIDGLTVDLVTAWLRAVDSSYNEIVRCTFTRATATGSRGSVKFVASHYNRVVDNVLDDGNDNLQFIHSDYNVAEGNRITLARHNLWSILCGNSNVIRGNFFHNAIQKAGQITDCEGVPSDATPSYDDAHRNLVEHNEFAHTASSGDASPYAGIQYAAQDGIIRRNIFHDTIGPALDLTLYSDEARNNYGNRVYHNVLVRSSFAGVSIAPAVTGTMFSDNRLQNNVLADTVFVANDTRWAWYTDVLDGQPVQLLTGRLDGFLVENNLIFAGVADVPYAVTYGQRWSTTNPPPSALSTWESSQPSLFRASVDMPPAFVDAAANDFRPDAGSALIDAGLFLTTTVSAGSGTTLAVADSSYFFDGFGIPGEQGDLIQLDGETTTARVIAIDDVTNTLTLDVGQSWVSGQGVTLAYEGAAPDIGAFEVAVCVVPPAIVDGVRAVKAPPGLTLSWAAPSDAATASWNVWKVVSEDATEIPVANGANAGATILAVGTCTGVPLPTPVCVEPESLAAAPRLVLYQVRAACSDGTEGAAHPF